MPLRTSSYTKQTAREALHWLKEQKEDWARQVQDVDIAVQLYLNFKTRQRIEKREFSKELQKLCVNGSGPLKVQKQDEKPDSILSLCADHESVSSPDSVPISSSPSVFLDERNRELLTKTMARLNLSREKEALNVLIQLGFSSLKNLLKDI